MKKITTILIMIAFVTGCSSASRAPNSDAVSAPEETQAPDVAKADDKCKGMNALDAGKFDEGFKKLQADPHLETLVTIDPKNLSLIVYERSGDEWVRTKGSQLDPALVRRDGSTKAPQGIYPKARETFEFRKTYQSAKFPEAPKMNYFVRIAGPFAMMEMPEKTPPPELRNNGLIFIADGDGDQSMGKTIYDLLKAKPQKSRVVISNGMHAGLRNCPI